MEKDYFEYHDEETLTSIINDNIFLNESCNISNITAYGFTVGRQSKDKTVNHFGKNLLNLCKHCNIFILMEEVTQILKVNLLVKIVV